MESDPKATVPYSPSPNEPASMTQFNRYRIVRFLGQGGMGRVYLGWHSTIQRPCALKLLPTELARNQAWVDRFATEAQMLAKLNHPNIVQVFNAEVSDGECFLEMEFVDGGDLQQRVDKSVRPGSYGLESETCRRITDEILNALDYAHRLGVIHRDLKPGNILLAKDGSVKVSDFGLATVVGDDFHKSLIEKSITLSRVGKLETMSTKGVSHAGSFAGTILYMSPQALRGEEPDTRDDLYAVGVIAYFMLTGKTPSVNFTLPSKIRPGLSRRWDSFIRRCLEETREDRFQDAGAARRVLAKVGEESGPLKWVVALGAAAVLAVAGVMAWQKGYFQTEPSRVEPIVPAVVAPEPVKVAPVATTARQPEAIAPQREVIPFGPEVTVPRPAALPAGGPVPVLEVEAGVVAQAVEQRPAPAEVAPAAPAPVVERADASAVAESSEVVPAEMMLNLPMGVALQLVRIPAGELMLGPEPDELGRSTTDSPNRKFASTAAFLLAAFETTQDQYTAFGLENPSFNRREAGSHPVEQIRMDDILGRGGYLERLNGWLQENGLGDWEADLPTDEEWEYACRAMHRTPLNSGDRLADMSRDPALNRVAVYSGNARSTSRAGSKLPNRWGLYDMHGNVLEWTREGNLRGGAFDARAADCRASSRIPNQGGRTKKLEKVGFRVLLRPVSS